MANRDVVVIGGSAGSLPALATILRPLPSHLPAAIVIVIHIPASSAGLFSSIASSNSALPVHRAEQGMPLERGHVYIARPDRHLLVMNGQLHLGTGPRENLVRPAIDPLFRSAALSAGARSIGVILSGMLNDGASGLAAIKAVGGIALVQSPQHAWASDMPLAALEASDVDLSASPEELSAAIERHANEAPGPARIGPAGLEFDVQIATGLRLPKLDGITRLVAPLTCPDCGGVLSEVSDQRPLRFRCQVGHAFSGKVLLQEQEGEVDEAMRVALRIIQERVDLLDRMSRDARCSGRPGMAELYERRAEEYRSNAESLQDAVLLRMQSADVSGLDSVVASELRTSVVPE